MILNRRILTRITLSILLQSAILNACATRSEMSRFYRDCDGRVSYVLCPAPPPSYRAKALKKDGSLAELSEAEKQAMLIFLGAGETREKVEKLEALGYVSSSGVDSLEFLLCSQYTSCALTREQYSQFRHNILPIIEKD